MRLSTAISNLRDSLDEFEDSADLGESSNVKFNELLDDELLDEFGNRFFDDSIKTICENIVQKHRLGQDWQADALEVIYNIANKVV